MIYLLIICAIIFWRPFQYLMNAYSEMRINNDMSEASIDAKEQEAMTLWEAPDKEGNQSSKPPMNNTSALIR